MPVLSNPPAKITDRRFACEFYFNHAVSQPSKEKPRSY